MTNMGNWDKGIGFNTCKTYDHVSETQNTQLNLPSAGKLGYILFADTERSFFWCTLY